VLWGRAYQVTLDDAGLFNVALSDEGGAVLSDGSPTNGLANALAANVGSSLYLGLTVTGSEAEISPRQKLLAVPVATMALDATSASGNLAVAGEVHTGTAKSRGGVSSSSARATQDATVGGNLAIGGKLNGLGMFPVGSIVLWNNSVSTIPDGWRLCDGTSGTPNLSGRFVVGYDAGDGDYTAVGKTGGEKTHKLTVSEMPSHSHSITMWGGDIADDWKNQNSLYLTHDKYGYHNDREFSSVGGDQPHENRPPYYVLCYIMRVR